VSKLCSGVFRGVGLRFWVSVLVFVVVVWLVLSVPRAFAAGSEEADLAVSDADAALRGAFVHVSDAEGAGANVSGLMGRLNEAGDALAGARAALEMENYSDAVSRADLCKSLASGVVGDTDALKTDALAAKSSWWITISFSVVGSAVFVVALFLAWRWFRRFYAAKLLNSKPEVVK
jgi:hypothetical protein